MGERTIYSWPGGLQTLTGGTRVAIKLSRPWQKDIEINPERCNFCTTTEEPIAYRKEWRGWRILGNPMSPHKFHRLIVPARCWPLETLRTLGGMEEIKIALEIAHSILQAEDTRLTLGVHVGASAGQNLPHLHWHIVETNSMGRGNIVGELREFYKHHQDLIFLESEGLYAAVGGFKSGQCFLLSKATYPDLDSTFLDELATFLFKIISLYAVKFKSVQGLPPDYLVAFTFVGTNIRYGCYVPILDHWGFPSYLGLLGDDYMVLPWPHEVTAEYLKKQNNK